jgi:hypothetical protein
VHVEIQGFIPAAKIIHFISQGFQFRFQRANLIESAALRTGAIAAVAFGGCDSKRMTHMDLPKGVSAKLDNH